MNNKEFYQGAMYNGTLLGAVWSIMYILLFAGTTNMFALSLCMSLFISSPFIAARLSATYRKKELDNHMTYIQAWIFLFYMYLCATLLSALVAYIYLQFIDNGTFFITLQNMLEESIKIADTDDSLAQQIELTKKILEQTTNNNFVWQLMNNNLTNALIMPLIIAVFVKKNKQQSQV